MAPDCTDDENHKVATMKRNEFAFGPLLRIQGLLLRAFTVVHTAIVLAGPGLCGLRAPHQRPLR